MAFKVNVSHNGKTYKAETDNEELVGISIGDTIEGKLVSTDLEGYELIVTGTSDKAGFPGLKDVKGSALKRVILKKGVGMKNNIEGMRKRKTIRGTEISADIVQINTAVKKEGSKKFSEIYVEKPKEVKK